jgi:hypothetical protein
VSFSLALSVVVMVLGLLFYVYGAKLAAWLVEIGRIMFAVGLLISLLRLGGAISANIFRQ